MTNIEAYKWLYEHFTPCGDIQNDNLKEWCVFMQPK